MFALRSVCNYGISTGLARRSLTVVTLLPTILHHTCYAVQHCIIAKVGHALQSARPATADVLWD